MHINKVMTYILKRLQATFVNINLMLASTIPGNSLSYNKFLSTSMEPSLFLKPTNEIEIKNVISRLKEGAYGRYCLSSNDIKCIKEQWLHFIHIILQI